MTSGKNLEDLLGPLGKNISIKDILQCDDVQAVLRDPQYGLSYVQNPELAKRAKLLFENLDKSNRTPEEKRQAGDLLEQVAVAALMGICPNANVDSYRRGTSQIDVFCDGGSQRWKAMCKHLGIKKNGTIITECKATKDPVDDATFSRLCSMLTFEYPKFGLLGIFFSINGASGFPEPGAERQSSLTAARLKQALFYAKTGKPIVVLTRADIEALAKGENFVALLRTRVLDVETNSGVGAVALDDTNRDELLPDHIGEVVLACRPDS